MTKKKFDIKVICSIKRNVSLGYSFTRKNSKKWRSEIINYRLKEIITVEYSDELIPSQESIQKVYDYFGVDHW